MSKSYRYDKALNTVETQAKSEKRTFRLNLNNQITAVYNQNGEQERYAYDECGYLTQQAQGVTLGRGSHEDERHIQHQDIYQQGHKLNRLNQHYYTYDKAGRLTEKTEIRDGFRQKTTYYRWNGNNQLTSLTNHQGEVWYYQYDALGRRISKECPQQRLKITYLWDGDQLAFTRTFKNNEIISERHSIFNGFELIAQQDRYQQLKHTIDGNIVEWIFETSYAVCQPNGQVLALLNPKGRTLWRKEKQTLWGLCFPNEYKQPNPLDPQLLFAGQYFDEESGLAYNRFRYYDPESGNYISSDPIGLSGGERPFGYVGNPLDWVDLFGLAGCPLQDIFDDIDKWSLSPISSKQKGMIRDKLSTVKQRSKELNEKMRKHFVKNQSSIIKEWEVQTGMNWPKLANGKAATPHHAIPLKNGGANEWWNIVPVNNPHTGTIHGTGSALRTHLPLNQESGHIWNLL